MIALTFVRVEKYRLTSTSVPVHSVHRCLFVPMGWDIVHYGWGHGEMAMGFGDSRESCSFKCENMVFRLQIYVKSTESDVFV
jgi:hypothetical protein